MEKILFSHSYFLRFDPKQWSLGQPYPPLGTLYAAAVMRERGYQVSLFDTMFVENPDQLNQALDEKTSDFFVLYDDGFNYLTKMCLTNMRQAAFRMCKLAKERGCIVIVSSSDSTDRFSEYLSEGADFVLLGEAEQTLSELIETIKNGVRDLNQVNGIAYLKDARPLKTAARSVLKDLDALPLPAWDLVDMNLYRQIWKKTAGYFSINMGTTRGCPYKCNWCAKPIYGNRYNSRSPEHVVGEIKLLKENYGIDHIWFCDDIFGLKPGWIMAFSSLLKKENINIRFKIQSRADLLIEDELVRALTAAGCDNVWIGAESGSQKILDAMDKGITIEQIHRASRLMKKHGIKPSFFIQFGYLGETKQDIGLTIEMINKLLPYEIGISISYPLPGTLFYDKVKADLKTKTNWTDSDEMALLFSSSFSAYYYKQLPRYVHNNYRKHLAKNSFSNLIAHPSTVSAANIRKALSVFYYTPLSYIEKIRLNRFEKTLQ